MGIAPTEIACSLFYLQTSVTNVGGQKLRKMTGLELIAKERKEQIEKHGYTVDNDVQNNNNRQLLNAAGALMTGSMLRPTSWEQESWQHMMLKSKKERLIIAGALIAAEIDRLNAGGE